jgi:hypothetical protein
VRAHKPEALYLCELAEGGIFALVGDERIRVQIDSTRKVSQETAEGICRAVGEPWFLIADDCEKFRLSQCSCSRYFISQKHNRRYCSDACAKASATERQAVSRAASKQNRSEQAANAVCIWCKEPMEAQRLSKKFCSARCRQAASRRWR